MSICNICQRDDTEELFSFEYYHPSCEKTTAEILQTVSSAYKIPPDANACYECHELLSKCYLLRDIWKQLETINLATDGPLCLLCKAHENAEQFLSIPDTQIGTFESISDLLNHIDWLHTLHPDNSQSAFCCEQCFLALLQVNVLFEYLNTSVPPSDASQTPADDGIDSDDAVVFSRYEEEGIIYIHSLDEGKNKWRDYVQLIDVKEKDKDKDEDEDEDEDESYQTFLVIGKICCGCRRFFASELELTEHQEMVHADASSNESYSCDRCSTKFDSIAKFQHHQQLVLGATCYHCKLCDILTLNYKELRHHFQICRGHRELQDEKTQEKELLFCQHGVEERTECDYRCCGCMQEFANNEELLHHCKGEHFPHRMIPANFQCQLCYRNFNNRVALTRHYKIYQAKVSYRCFKCQYTTSKRSLMVAHLKLPDNCPQVIEDQKEGSLHYCCFCRCYQSFGSYEELKNHCEEAHSRERFKLTAFQRTTNLECELCGRCFLRRSNYNDHLRSQRYRDHACNHCELKFSKEKHLVAHIKNVHTKGKPKRFLCTQCNEAFSSPSVRARHYNVVHRTEKPFICNQCGNGFNSNNNLQTHILFIHTEYKVWACEICPARFKMKQTLLAHNRRHTKERPYSCQFCDKKYRNQQDCTRHVKSIHMNQKPFQCEQCGASYSRDRELRLHQRKHTGRKLFSCNGCSFESNNHSSFKDHTSRCPNLPEQFV